MDQHIKNWNENADLLPEGHLQEGHLQEGCRLHKDVLIRNTIYCGNNARDEGLINGTKILGTDINV